MANSRAAWLLYFMKLKPNLVWMIKPWPLGMPWFSVWVWTDSRKLWKGPRLRLLHRFGLN